MAWSFVVGYPKITRILGLVIMRFSVRGVGLCCVYLLTFAQYFGGVFFAAAAQNMGDIMAGGQWLRTVYK